MGPAWVSAQDHGSAIGRWYTIAPPLTPEADQEFGRTAAEPQREVHAIERACDENQGVAHRLFLRELCNNPEAVTKLQGWAGEFTEAARHRHADASRGRMISSFAITYAAARLAIEYGILPWGWKSTRAALLRCVTNALAHLPAVELSLG